MSRNLFALLMLSWTIPTFRADAADPPAKQAETILVRKCLIDYERSSQVGAIFQGTSTTVLQECLVRPGDRVKQGQVLGRLQNKDLQADLLRSKAEADNLLDIQIAKNKHEQAVFQQKRAEKLVVKNVTTAQAVTLFRLEAEAAELEVERSVYLRSLAQLRLKEVEAQFRNRDFTSPHNGIVLEAFKNEGERVSTSDPVFLVVDDTILTVTGQLDVVDAWRVQRGQRIRVVAEIDGAELPIEQEEFSGRVIFVDGRIDPLTRTCKIVARIENRDLLLRSGLEALMKIELGERETQGRDKVQPPQREQSMIDTHALNDTQSH